MMNDNAISDVLLFTYITIIALTVLLMSFVSFEVIYCVIQ